MVACMVLCFSFVAEAVLIVCQYLAIAGELNAKAFFPLFSPNRNRLDVRSGSVGCSQDTWRKLTKGAFHTILHYGQAIKVKKVGYWWLRCLSFYVVGWGAALLEVGEHLPVNENQWINFSIWLYLHAWLLSSLSNCHYFDWWGFLFSFSSSPHLLEQGGMSERNND